ncbi:hypothetical protein O6H91_08G107900 [Diphasiastrum complanatum]|uniref:Uncharacterized protein n=1 Tax=Diphasiastrum complanatum TaxID=34168 RepID=A0ACC2D0Y0_DIPCM|nr:hypothetical protein O6H91_08G107900 [Diphasiastrum complanatum]
MTMVASSSSSILRHSFLSCSPFPVPIISPRLSLPLPSSLAPLAAASLVHNVHVAWTRIPAKLAFSPDIATLGGRKPSHLLLSCAATFRSFSILESKVEEADNKISEAERGTIFVAGANGNTGKRIVKELLSKGFKVRAGVLDIDRARNSIPKNDDVEFVLADVTEDPDRLARAIGNVDAIICATGYRRSFDLLAPWKVDNLGTVHLVDASRKNGVKRFILVSSILVNGAAVGQVFNPAYIVLNVLGLTLIAKLQAENYIRRSGINYTIIRPGGLKNDPPAGNLVVSPEDTLFEGSISRDLVAQVAVESLLHPEASYKEQHFGIHIACLWGHVKLCCLKEEHDLIRISLKKII